jgi:hypothetical protein
MPVLVATETSREYSDKNHTKRDGGFMDSWLPDYSITQRHATSRNNASQKLQQTILKLRRCPHSVAATSQLCLLSRKTHFLDSSDVMAKERECDV